MPETSSQLPEYAFAVYTENWLQPEILNKTTFSQLTNAKGEKKINKIHINKRTDCK